MKGTLVDRSVAEKAKRYPVLVAIFRCERQSCCERHVSADDRVPAIHVIFLVEEVHRAAESLRAASRFPEKFRHARVRTGSARQGVAVITIGGDDVIVIAHRSYSSNDDRFLANIEMAEAADLLRLILLARAFLEAANQQHQREHLDFVALLGPLHRSLRDARQCSSSAGPAGVSPEVHAPDGKEREEKIAERCVAEKHPGRG